MKILYNPEDGFVVTVSPYEPRTIVRTMETLITEFETDSDVSFLRAILETAKSEMNHTLN